MIVLHCKFLHTSTVINNVFINVSVSTTINAATDNQSCVAPRCKNRIDPFAGQTLYKATKPGFSFSCLFCVIVL